jgi:hypothetical protein
LKLGFVRVQPARVAAKRIQNSWQDESQGIFKGKGCHLSS